MAFPVIATSNTTADTDASPTTVAMPASISAGDLLIVICAADAGDTITQSGGSDWTKLEQTNQAGVIGLIIFAKIAAGSDALTLTSTGSNDIACVSLRITGHGVSNVSTDITRGTASTGTDANPNPPNCNPGSAKDYLWIEMFAADDDDDTTPYESTNYTAVQQIQSANSTSSCLCAVASRDLNASAENPGVMAIADATEEWVAQTIAIPPVATSQVTQTWTLRDDLTSTISQTWTLRHDMAAQVTQTWPLRYDLASSITQTWNLRHDLLSKVEQIWNLRHDLSSTISQIWTLRHDMSGSVTNTWNLRHDLLNSVEQLWNLRHDLASAVSQTWSLRHDLAAQIERIWTLRHDLSSKIEQVWNLRHDLLSFVSQIWTLRHDLAADEEEPPAPVINPVRGFKRVNRPQFFMPLTKAITVKFRIPIFWVNKLDIKLDLPVYYDVIYTKRITVHSIREQKIKLNTSITSTIKAKINTFKESIQNISLRPDFRLQKMKNLSKLRKLLNNMEKVD